MRFDWWKLGFDVRVQSLSKMGCYGTKDVTLTPFKENPLQSNRDAFFGYVETEIWTRILSQTHKKDMAV